MFTKKKFALLLIMCTFTTLITFGFRLVFSICFDINILDVVNNDPVISITTLFSINGLRFLFKEIVEN